MLPRKREVPPGPYGVSLYKHALTAVNKRLGSAR
jgi:hypothetical protein